MQAHTVQWGWHWRVNALIDDLKVFGNGVYVLKYTSSDTSAMEYTIIIDKRICDVGEGGVGGGELVIEVLTLAQTRSALKHF